MDRSEGRWSPVGTDQRRPGRRRELSGKPRNGLQTSPSRREAARREQAQHDSPSLEAAVTCGGRPAPRGRLGSGTARRPARDASTKTRPSLCAASRVLLRLCRFERTISPGGGVVKGEGAGKAGAGRRRPLVQPAARRGRMAPGVNETAPPGTGSRAGGRFPFP